MQKNSDPQILNLEKTERMSAISEMSIYISNKEQI